MNAVPVNLSRKFQVYDGQNLSGGFVLCGSFDTLDEARRYLTQLSLSAFVVYPAFALDINRRLA